MTEVIGALVNAGAAFAATVIVNDCVAIALVTTFATTSDTVCVPTCAAVGVPSSRAAPVLGVIFVSCSQLGNVGALRTRLPAWGSVVAIS